MVVVTELIMEDRLREQGWVYKEMDKVGPRWQHVRFPNDGFSLSDALYLEWQDALARAGQAEHNVSKVKQQLAAILFCLFATVTAGLSFAVVHAFLK